MASVDERICERDCELYEEELSSKFIVSLYKTFSKELGFKNYLHSVSDSGSKLLFKGMHGLNEELGRHRDREGKVEFSFCGAECESVVHVLWECPAYSSS